MSCACLHDVDCTLVLAIDELTEQNKRLREALGMWLDEVPDGRFRPHHWKAMIDKSRYALGYVES